MFSFWLLPPSDSLRMGGTLFPLVAVSALAVGSVAQHTFYARRATAAAAGGSGLAENRRSNLLANAVADQSSHRVVAIGDIHGDLDNCYEALRLAQVIDDDHHWATGTDTVVQMGDVVDRGPHGHSILDYLRTLQSEAREKGGEFIQLLGNHELMDWSGDLKFVPPEQISAFGGLDAWKGQFMNPSGRYGSRILQLPPAAVRNETLFIHAGLPMKYARGGVDALNAAVQSAMRERTFGSPLLGAEGPLWTRSQLHAAQRGDCRPVTDALSELSEFEATQGRPPVRRMVVGHTIQPNGAIRSYCDGALWAIDICISQYMQGCGHLGHLELRRVTSNGNGTHLGAFRPGASIIVPQARYPPQPWRRHRNRVVQTFRGPSGLRYDPVRFQAFSRRSDTDAVVLAAIALGVVVWRVTHAWRRRNEVGMAKKSDDATTTV